MTAPSEPDPLERWHQLQWYVPYGGIAIGTLLTMFLRDDDWPSRPLTVAVAAVAAL